MKQKSEFNGMLLNVGLPIFFQGLVSALLNIVDTMMISSLGPAEISAVWLAGQCAFLMSLFSFGVAGGLSVFVSQYWGGKNVKGIRKVQILALSVSLAVSLVMFISAQIFPRGIMSLLSRDAQVITLGVPYLRIVSFGYLLLPFTNVFGIVLKTTERARIAAVSTMAALSSNTLLNYILIFGHLGFPRLGVRGASVAMLISYMIEAAIVLLFSYRRKTAAALKVKDFHALRQEESQFIRKFFKFALPVMANETLWAIGSIIYAAVYGSMGAETTAAYAVFYSIDRVIYAAGMALAYGALAIVGKTIGEGDEARAYRYGKRLIMLAIGTALFLGLLLFIFKQPVVSLFSPTEQVRSLAVGLLSLYVFFLWIRFTNTVNIVGTLRSGGDTRVGILIDLGFMWGLAIPAVLVGALVFHLSLFAIYFITMSEETIKFVIGLWRFRSKKWIHHVHEHQEVVLIAEQQT